MTLDGAFIKIDEFLVEMVENSFPIPEALSIRKNSIMGRQTDPNEAMVLRYPMGVINGEYRNLYDQFDLCTTQKDHLDVVKVLASHAMTRGEYEFFEEHPEFKIVLSVGRAEYIAVNPKENKLKFIYLPHLDEEKRHIILYQVFAMYTNKRLFHKPEDSILSMGTVYPSLVKASQDFIDEQMKRNDQVIAITPHVIV